MEDNENYGNKPHILLFVRIKDELKRIGYDIFNSITTAYLFTLQRWYENYAALDEIDIALHLNMNKLFLCEHMI